MSSTRTRIHPDKNPEQTQENKKMWLSINVNLEVLRAHADFGTELANCRKKRKQKQKTEGSSAHLASYAVHAKWSFNLLQKPELPETPSKCCHNPSS
jgi:hypothetical protein